MADVTRLPIAAPGGASDVKMPAFQQPTEIASFSLGKKREYLGSPGRLRFYTPPKDVATLPNLSEGLETFEKRQHAQEYLDNLLTVLQTSGLPTADGIVTWRGILTRIVCTPHSRDDWEFLACRLGNHIFICEEKEPDSFTNAEHQRSTYWGYKFEQLVTSDRPETTDEERMAASRAPVNNSEEYCSVIKTKLGGHRLVFGAEVDCCDETRSNLVELKTCGVIDSDRSLNTFRRHRLLKFWAQSFLAGIRQVIVGFRDGDGWVRELKRYATSDLPRIARQADGPVWEPRECLAFGERLLDALRQRMFLKGAENVYIVRRRRNDNVVTIERSSHAPFIPAEFEQWHARTFKL